MTCESRPSLPWTNSVWSMHGSTILLLYGRAFEQLNRPHLADLAYINAAELAARDRGSAYITAQSARANLAELQGDALTAFRLTGKAFAAVLGGRARIGQESYKLSFVTNAQSVSDQYFRLPVVTGVSPDDFFDAIEAWRLQVFKDVYPGSLAEQAQHGLAGKLRPVLRPDEAYVAYAIGSRRSVASVVRPADVQIKRLDIDRDRLVEDLVPVLHRWLDPGIPEAAAFINAGRVPDQLQWALRTLYDALIVPLCLPTNVHRLLVSPDETLISLPWGALLQPDRGLMDKVKRQSGFQGLYPLYERFAISIVLSAQGFVAELPAAIFKATGRVALIGAFSAVPAAQVAQALPIEFSNRIAPIFQEFTHGLGELSTVADAFAGHPMTVALNSGSCSKSIRLSASDIASAGAVRALMSRASVVHVAGQGVYNRTVPNAVGNFPRCRESQRLDCGRYRRS